MELDFSLLLTTVATMFIILLVGFAARKLGYIDEKCSKYLSNLIICVGQPFMIIDAVVSIPYSAENLKTAVYILILGTAVHALTALIAYFAVFRMKNQDERRISEFGLLFANCGFLGFPILRSLFGDLGVFWGSFYVIVFNIVTWTYGMFILKRVRSEIKMSPLRMVWNYGTTPCVIGLLLFLLRIKLPAPLSSAVSYIGSLCTPLSMLIVGGLLATIPFKKLFTSGKVYYVCAVKLFLIPAAVILAARLFGLPDNFTLFAAVMSALPTAANSSMFGERYGICPEYGAHLVGMSTLLSSFTVPVMLFLANQL